MKQTLLDHHHVHVRHATPPAESAPLRVVHLVESAGATDRLWGKEKVIVALMEAQRASGQVEPELITFTPSLLDEKMRAAGFRVESLGSSHQRLPLGALSRLRRNLRNGPPAVVHTHEYKANIFARLARASGARMRRLVATCHGWVDSTSALNFYYAWDRLTACGSDVVTVTDPAMLAKFPPLRPRQTLFVQNAIPRDVAPTANDRAAARAHFGFPQHAMVIGSMGRLTEHKGILDLLAAARRTANTQIVWAIAGSGPLEAAIEASGANNIRFVGYQSDSGRYLAALDAYVQASYSEGLSLSLLEALRSGLAIASTKAGATEFAVREGVEALLFDAGDIDSLVAVALRLHADPELKARLGRAARARFEAAFDIDRQHRAFLELYLA